MNEAQKKDLGCFYDDSFVLLLTFDSPWLLYSYII